MKDNEKKFKTREEILGMDDLPLEELYIPEWDSYVFVRALNGRERTEFEQSQFKVEGKNITLTLSDVLTFLAYFGTCNPDGSRFFTRKDIEKLGGKNASALDRIAGRIQVLSRLTKEDLRDLTENFTVSQDGGSTSN